MADNLFDLTDELLFQQMHDSQQQDWALPTEPIYIPSDVNYLNDFLNSPFASQTSVAPHQQPQQQHHHHQQQQQPYPSPLSQTPQQPPLDENGNPIKIRKRPGRKPNPQSPAIRK
jgi:hypothetical protein